MRCDAEFHIEQVHPEKLEREGVSDVYRRLYHISRAGVRILGRRRYRWHLSQLPDLPKEEAAQVKQIINHLLLDALVLVGDERQTPSSNHKEFSALVRNMK